MKEKWKDIPNYEGLYQISNLGNVRSLRYNKEKIMKPIIKHNTYAFINLSKNKTTKTFILHRLVAQAFIPNSLNKPCINHIDCNPSNNRIDNLEWCSYQENTAYMIKLNRRGGNKKVNNEDVRIIRNMRKEGLNYKKVWEEYYKEKIGFSGFQQVWYEMNWRR